MVRVKNAATDRNAAFQLVDHDHDDYDSLSRSISAEEFLGESPLSEGVASASVRSSRPRSKACGGPVKAPNEFPCLPIILILVLKTFDPEWVSA